MKIKISAFLLMITAAILADQLNPLTLWYRQPAREWTEALPIGNGRLGAMVFGGVEHEHLSLNEESMWTGHPIDHTHKDQPKILQQARELVFQGEYVQAEKLLKEKFMSPRLDGGTHSYQMLADLDFTFPHKKWQNYKRTLDLEKAIATVSYSAHRVNHKREYFSSPVDQVLVMRFSADKPGSISFHAQLSRQADAEITAFADNGLQITGTLKNGGVDYAAKLSAFATNGTVSADSNGLTVADADEVVIMLTAATNYFGGNPHESVDGFLSQAQSKSFDELQKAHVQEHQRLFKRVSLDLGQSAAVNFSTDERLLAMREGAVDPQLVALYYQYGRYLLISSSRPGALPANLQGIWDGTLNPPWNADYHVNINIQMNYWPAELTNLSECHEPFFQFINNLRPSGSKTAKTAYGCRGFMAHHTTDAWFMTHPFGDPQWGMWQMGAAWCTRHFWQHYLYTGDKQFLKETAYPVMKDAALFLVDFLVEDPNNGYLVTGPSNSPENQFIAPNGEPARLNMGPTMDIEIVHEVFSNCIAACEILDTDKRFAAKLQKLREQLPPLQIGSDGRLMEWVEEFEEAEPGHRHISHLYALHPAGQITPQYTPELAAAARNTIDYRLQHGGGHTGWSRAWIINFFARLWDGEKAYENVLALLRKSTLLNLFDTHPPFQIDGNFGGTSGITEMLLQSHSGEIVLLPALPKAWANGSVTGLKARGGFTVDMRWQRGRIVTASIYSEMGGNCRIRVKNPVVVVGAEEQTAAGENPNFFYQRQAIPQLKMRNPGAVKAMKIDDAFLIDFATEAGQVYTLLEK